MESATQETLQEREEIMRNYRRASLMAGAVVLLLIGAALMLWGGTATEASNDTTAADDGKGGSVWGANYFPNVPLITHDGRTVRFFDDLVKDKVVAINFIYTSCPDACPMETARMLEVQKLLGDRVGKDVFFYSITIDPEYDTQPVLEKYVKDWNIGPGWWFLTGKEEDITLLRKKLGVYDSTILDNNPNNHKINLVIGNQATGRWMKRSPYENPYILASQLGGWLHNWKMPSTAKRNYDDAPEIRQISTGENLFRTRCASCHTIGRGEVVDLAERRIGPDLLNITAQRDRAWLERWLAEPDVMLEEEDPLAMALLAQYNNVPMPNLRLTKTDIEKLLGYIDEESGRIQRTEAAQMAAADPHAGHHMGHHAGHHEGHSGSHGESTDPRDAP
jgi:protein SCO1/2